ncbi:FliM/FliN family flagellar motor switch protein [Limnobacter sp. 130]|jgi:flagellar motor switch/type III secretory pathway protein FliN|uniref:FliM/FliN family flagellar motor switch protein n=1 Tax=Limnobacter sp. 130 TaxID=2653147 RepID=UPI0012F22E74|nr:FliM/FliN family flagellar motor switch protein [Limnobacter sp. 130]VWX34804.1 conserved hypothetical protein [Limnobacter sp. 130]
MEIAEHINEQEVAQVWALDRLRTVRYDATSSTIFARSRSMSQRIYYFDTDRHSDLVIRRTTGLPHKSTISDLIWVSANFPEGNEIQIGLDSAYIFEQTGSLITPQTVDWGGEGIVPLIDIVSAVLNELESILGLHVEDFLPAHQMPTSNPSDYLAVDYKRQNKLILLSDKQTLKLLEAKARNYCLRYWNDYESMGKKVFFELSVYLYPTKRKWLSTELAELEQGDLVALQNFRVNASSRSIRGSLRFKGDKFSKRNYEVFIEMNEDDTRLHFGSDDLSDTSSLDEENLPPHEQIELEIHAGKTKILFNELCSVQEGTLIELREHALPMVTLCVMGSPILEGELVHFQDQLMVQVTKRLD